MTVSNTERVDGMLLRFKFSNFRCFADETVFDMTATAIREHKNTLIEKNGVQVLPVSAFYGANASGKSTFFKALSRMMTIICRNSMISPVKNYSFSIPFIFDNKSDKSPTEFEICFSIAENEYRYGFECNRDSIICEYLYKKKLSKNKTIERIIFERDIESVNVGDKIPKNIKDEIEYCASMRSDKILMLTNFGERDKEKELCDIYRWFLGQSLISSAIDVYLYEDLIGRLINMRSDDIILKKIISFISEIDPCIADIKAYESINRDGNIRYTLKTIHIYNGKITELPFEAESDGTKRVLLLSYLLFFSLTFGLPCYIDELDLNLHPLLMRKIIKMFKNKEFNEKGAQLIFSAHNIVSLDSSDLRRDEIWFVEKEDQKSFIYSLYDFEDDEKTVRSDLSFGKHYLSGRFGAVPFQKGDCEGNNA